MVKNATTHEGNRNAVSRDRILRCTGHWTLSLEVGRGTEISGDGITRDDAISNAERAIDRAIQRHRLKPDLDGEDR